jgi:hypothetical protein
MSTTTTGSFTDKILYPFTRRPIPKSFLWMLWIAYITFLLVYYHAEALPFALERWGRGACSTDPIAPVLLPAPYCGAIFSLVNYTYLFLSITISTLILWRNQGRRMAVLIAFMLTAFCYGTLSAILYTSRLPDRYPLSTPFVAFGFAMAYLTMIVFPDGHMKPRRARWLFISYLIWMSLWFVFPDLYPLGRATTSGRTLIGLLVLTAAALPVIGVQVIRYQKFSNATERQQTKWAVFGIIATAIFYGTVTILEAVLEATARGSVIQLFWSTVAAYFRIMALSLVPLTMGIATFRFRLWEIDLVVSRTLVVAVVTLVVGGLFGGMALISQQVIGLLFGTQPGSIAVTVAALVTAVLFNPVLTRLKTAIDKRFYPKYLAKSAQFQSADSPIQPPTDAMHTQTDRVIGTYRIIEPIGRGGMSEIYRGEHLTLNRSAAIKVMTLHGEATARTRFEREARTVANLRHPNIIQIFDFGVIDLTFYMAMEYVEGSDLAVYLRGRGTLPFSESLGLLHGVADALDYAHSEGVIHRDVKPQNILLQPVTRSEQNTQPYRPIITDFGIAKLTESQGGLTQTGVLGTLDYIAPEQIINAAQVTHTVDIYALGVVAFQMLTGRLPFVGGHAGAVILAHLQQPPPDARILNPALSSGAARALRRVLAKEPTDRYNTAKTFVLALGDEDD